MVEDLFFMLSKSVKKGITDSLKDETGLDTEESTELSPARK